MTRVHMSGLLFDVARLTRHLGILGMIIAAQDFELFAGLFAGSYLLVREQSGQGRAAPRRYTAQAATRGARPPAPWLASSPARGMQVRVVSLAGFAMLWVALPRARTFAVVSGLAHAAMVRAARILPAYSVRALETTCAQAGTRARAVSRCPVTHRRPRLQSSTWQHSCRPCCRHRRPHATRRCLARSWRLRRLHLRWCQRARRQLCRCMWST